LAAKGARGRRDTMTDYSGRGFGGSGGTGDGGRPCKDLPLGVLERKGGRTY